MISLFNNKKDEVIYNKTKSYLEKNNDIDINSKMKIISKILKITDQKERYSYLYDLICDYLDNEFKTKNICGFNCGICKRRQNMIDRKVTKDTYLNGCCHGYKNGDCKYLISGKGCSIKNMACKLFTCFYLRKEGYRYKLNNIYLSKYFFNKKQKYYLENTFFVDKDTLIEGLMKRG